MTPPDRTGAADADGAGDAVSSGPGAPRPAAADARRFVVLLGWVSLLADLCYESLRAAVGPYLATLGASATAVGIVAGTGEMLGYALRYLSGLIADRTGRYWLLTSLGYASNLVAAPLLAVTAAFTTWWPAVAVLVAIERLGKAIRSPAKSTLTSFAAKQLGAGKAFAIAEAMDQVGGMLGPLLVAAVLWRWSAGQTGFTVAFAVLTLPAVACLAVLSRARRAFPDPRSLERGPESATAAAAGLPPRVRLYLLGVALIAIGLADWPLLAFHFERTGAFTGPTVMIAYAAAMAFDGLVSAAVGPWFDRARAAGGSGGRVLAACLVASAGYGVLALVAEARWVIALGIALWAAGRAATDAIAKALIAIHVPAASRGRAYGLYYVVFGLAWWLGSVALGLLYDRASALAAALLAAVALVCGAGVVLLATERRPAASSTREP
ncbi:MAG TPA: MFS transporter [Kofleriaceae bacterium]|nr:MFS transporter [Kofleriaceae bacterium]